MKKWFVEVIEERKKTIVVAAPTPVLAEEYANELAQVGEIDMDKNLDAASIYCVCAGKASDNSYAYMMDSTEEWSGYLEYLKQWAESHADGVFYGQTPASFDEWCDSEFLEDGDE